MILLDTDVLIEFRKGSPKAVEWVSSLGPLILPLPGIVAMELLAGSVDRVQLDRSRKFLRQCDVIWHSEFDNELAYQLLERHRLSTGLSLADFFIAAQALNRSATLYSFNLKHFSAIPKLEVRSPYSR